MPSRPGPGTRPRSGGVHPMRRRSWNPGQPPLTGPWPAARRTPAPVISAPA